MAMSLRWDVFCRVVDNFGDAGVCWRLARQLAREHALAVTLWIDDVASLARIAPAVTPARADQVVDGVRIRRIAEPFVPDAVLPDVVIEGFGCGLPDAFVTAIAGAPKPPVWVVLEYLSAEPWIDASHGLPSPHPRLPLTRWFWFPGFTRRSGGLLREARLLETRDAFRSDPAAHADVWAAAGYVPAPDALRVSLFCYANPALPGLLDAWAEGDEPVVCVVPEGVARSSSITGPAAPCPIAGRRSPAAG